ncbi:ribosome biogenesis GTPase RsgA [Comamonas testosteroni TK102]|uniref:Small ribosomal subunit biogenesis GTPase RsgA n=1 Tax=Comamonas testosteroni TK102 TaxID=1392005 RepID=A0A076PKG3_COMTE|nr:MULTISPECIES: ribosome small subunit-dependent GTPase A [Comamonas]AIJ45171.1 ribosome biogenesis GTPase RsgA [Comamonas testosteroni TK102]MPS88348.1 ribosome small subunit-dependent GTPase A [Comamonas sp.]
MAKQGRRPGAQAAGSTQTGLVVASYGRHCVVETPDGERRICHPRGKKSQAVVGDHVQWLAPPPGQGDEGTIEKIVERRNVFYRQDDIRTKTFAANLDQLLILIAAEPVFSEVQLARALIAAEAAHIKPIIALNKMDLEEPFLRAWQRLEPYRTMRDAADAAPHYMVLPLSLEDADDEDRDAIIGLLQGKTTLVLGPSGVGKSTLINLLLPDAKVATNEISQALNTGKHTTTSTTLYWVDEARTTAIIDSPGFQEFGLYHLAPTQLAACMPDIGALADQCKFYNCTHLHEPGCAVMTQVEAQDSPHAIHANRYRIYGELFEELSQEPRY